MTLSTTNRQRGLIALVQVLALGVWFSATAVVPSLRFGVGHRLDGGGLADRVGANRVRRRGGHLGGFQPRRPHPPQYLLAASAVGAAACTAALAMFVHGLAAAIPLRFLTGMFLAGVYPVGMKLMASWSESATRGRSFGVLLGALTLGSALPHLISGLGPLPWRTVMLAAAALTATGAVVALTLVRPGPHLDIRAVTPNPRHAIAIFAQRGPRLVSLGYFGHMWELYALWTWLAMFVVAGRAATRRRGRRRPASSRSPPSESPGPSDACWAAGRQTVSAALRWRWRRW